MKRPLTVEVYLDTNKQVRFRIKGANNKVIIPVEGYHKKKACENTIATLQKGLATAVVKYLPPLAPTVKRSIFVPSISTT